MADEESARDAIGKYVQNYGRMRDLLQLIELPARGRSGSRVNARRARIVQAAVHQLKVAGAGYCAIKRQRGHCSLCRVEVPYRETRCAS